MESNKSTKRTYEFVKKNKANYLNPETFSDTTFPKFNSDDFDEWEEEYRDEEIKIKEIKKIKAVPEEIEEIEDVEEIEEIECLVALEVKDSKNKDIVYQGDRFFLTYGNRLGHISKEWVIEELRCKINDLDNQKENQKVKE